MKASLQRARNNVYPWIRFLARQREQPAAVRKLSTTKVAVTVLQPYTRSENVPKNSMNDLLKVWGWRSYGLIGRVA